MWRKKKDGRGSPFQPKSFSDQVDDFTLENVQKSNFLMGPKWSKNRCRSSFGSKEAHENHF